MSTSKKPTQTQLISSFDSSYVSLDLVSYMKSGQIMPFHIFNHSVMPDFLRQLYHRRAHFPHRTPAGATEEGSPAPAPALAAGSPCTVSDPNELLEEIKKDMAHIRNASRRLERWESDVNGAINGLVLQCLDDAFRESKEAEPDPAIRRENLLRIQNQVSALKEQIYQPLKFASDNNSESFKRSELSLTRLRGSGGEAKEEINQFLDVDIGRQISEQNLKEIQGIYDGLSEAAKKCFPCFLVFPENAVIKNKVLAHWWIGEGFIGDDDATTASGLFEEFRDKGLIEPVFKKQRPSADSFKMNPLVRYAAIELAERKGLAKFDEAKSGPTANYSDLHWPCLVWRGGADEEPGSSAWEFANSYASKQENVRTLFNVSEVWLEFKASWFSRMKNAKVLQLGKWQSSAERIVEVDSSEFLKGLKRMKHLRYLSLRGVSRIVELPSSVCKLSSLRILNLNGCKDLVRLPEGIGALKKLTHLDMYECYFISHMPKGISQLSELEILKGFVIGKTRPGFEGQHCQLEDLTKLKKLNKLNIHVDRTLENAKQELICFENFKNLESLSVSWSRIYYCSQSGPKGMKRVISQMKSIGSFHVTPREGKSPAASSKGSPNKLPEKLKKLDLHYFPSERISEWFSLEKIKGLEKLYIRDGNSLSDLSDERSCWKTVKFLRMKVLKVLAMEWRELRELFPEMVYLEMVDCPNLPSSPCDGLTVVESG